MYEHIPGRLAEIRNRIADAAGRAGRLPESVRLIAVSKTHPFDAVRAAADAAGLDEMIERLPEGLATVVGERGYRLSGGEKQRVAIARAVLKDPPILVLDEATASLDSRLEREIRESTARLAKGRTTIVIAHRPGTIALASRVVFIDNQTVAAIDKHEELVSTNARYREVLAGMQQVKTANTKVAVK